MTANRPFAELETFEARGPRVLSVYLSLDPARQVRRSYRAVFEELVKQLRERLEEPARSELAREAAQAQAWLEQQQPRGRALALFSCSALDFWSAYYLQVPVEDHLAFEPTPDLTLLLELQNQYERYAVALVDKKRARLCTVFLGALEQVEAFEDFVPGKHDQGGFAQARFRRHHEAHVHWHLKRVADRLAELLRQRHFDRLILAGPQEATGELARLLPRNLAQRLAATIPAELSAQDSEIVAKTLAVEARIEREVEQRLLDELFDGGTPGGRATVGLQPTLDALWSGQVQMLVVAEGPPPAGSECPDCGRLEPGEVPACPACGKATLPVHDLFRRAMSRAREQAGVVEVVHGDAARRLLETGGGLGALLRYPVAALQAART